MDLGVRSVGFVGLIELGSGLPEKQLGELDSAPERRTRVIP